MGRLMSMQVRTEWIALPVAAVAGMVALAGVVVSAGAGGGWLRETYERAAAPSGKFAEGAYAELLAGRTGAALERFQEAVRRDAASPFRWCDYGEALLAAGDGARARAVMRRAVELGPYVGPVRMREVNFAFRTGDRAWGMEQGRALLAMTGEYDAAVFQVWERMEVPEAEVLRAGIPDARAGRSYLRDRIAKKAEGEAAVCWDWLGARKFVDGKLADEYAGFLAGLGRWGDAAAAWGTWGGAQEPGYPAQNAIFNGGFEREPAGTVFDWRLGETAGAVVDRDGAAFRGAKALRIRFDGSENVGFGQVSERAAVLAGRYEFEGWMRTEEITTDQGVGFEVVDPEGPARVDVKTARLTGSHGWTRMAAEVAVPAGTRVLQVRVVRERSWKFDSKISGTAWVDEVALRRR